MAGHSKWSKIKRKKGANDAKRGQLFTRLLKEVQVAAKMGGGDVNGNHRLRATVTAAKSQGVPLDNIERAIKRGTGDLEGVDYEEVTYEGYGPGGVALLIKTLTDNKNRTVADVRHALSRSNGSLAAANAVAYLFNERCVFSVPKEAVEEDKLYDVALEAGAEDIVADGDSWVVTGEVASFGTLSEAVDTFLKGVEGEIQFIPETTVKVAGKEAESLFRLIEALDDLDDVQSVTANFDIEDAEMERLGL